MRQRGFGMVELMLGVTVAIVAGAGVFVLAKHADVRADVRQEQANAQEVSEAIAGAYLASPDYSTLSTATAAGILNRSLSGDSLNSAFHAPLTVRPATTTVANDSFELVYIGLTGNQCAGLASAVKDRTQGIYIGSHASVQALDGTVSDESQIAIQCAGLTSSDTVALRFYSDKSASAASTMDACTCAPQVDKQTLACPAGQVGSITQTRTGDCSGGTPACPSQAWNSWVTTANTCGSTGAPVAPVAPVSPSVPAACLPRYETRTGTCPSGQVGAALERRATACPSGAWGDWTVVSSSCVAVTPPASCTPQVGPIEIGGCPAGQGGQVLSQRSATCDAAGNLVWGAPQVVSSTCTASCALSGTCCRPTYRTQVVNQPCAVGSFGNGTTQSQRQSSVCASATATPTWSAPWTTVSVGGACSPCPADSASSASRWTDASAACPAGQVGTHTWKVEEVQTTTTTYACNHSAGVANSNGSSVVGGWVATGAKANEVNTCKVEDDVFLGKDLKCTWVMSSTGTPSISNAYGLDDCKNVQIDVGPSVFEEELGVSQMTIIPQITGVHGVGASIADPATWKFELASTPAPNYLGGQPYRTILFGYTRVGAVEVMSNFGPPCSKATKSIPMTATLTHLPTGRTKVYTWTLNFRSVCYPDNITAWPNRTP